MSSLLERAVALQKAPLFSGLAADVLVPLANVSEPQRLEPADILFEEGDLGDALYVIVSGELRIERGGRLVASLGPGECVGEMAALDREARSATAVALSSCHLVRIDGNDLMDTLADHPELVKSLIAVLVARIRESG